MRTVRFPDGTAVPALGQGTWTMGEKPSRRAGEIAALRFGLDRGLAVIDTAEMYGEGASERLVGEAVAGRRDEVFLVSKVYPHNADRAGVIAACERSLRRLATDRLDLYLLHWRGSVPLAETIAGFEALIAAGKIRRWGVSNFDAADMEELWALPGGRTCATNQVLCNPSRRGIEWDLRPALRGAGVPVMAYSPLEQARLLHDPGFRALAAEHGTTPAALALAWAIDGGDVLAIPKTGHVERVGENLGALAVAMTPALVAEIDRLFPPPTHAVPLEML